MPIRFLQSNSGRTRATGSSWNAWRCAGWATLALAGCVVTNVAGCGGGSNSGSPIPEERANARFLLTNLNGLPVNGTVTIGDQTQTTTNGRVAFNIKPGTYAVRYTIGGQSYTTSIVVARTGNPTFALVEGGTAGQTVRITGRILLNNSNDAANASCDVTSTPITGRVLVRLVALDLPERPTVASYIREDQTTLPISQQGRYTITAIPMRGTYWVEVRPAPITAGQPSPQFTGRSASFTISAGQSLNNVDLCASSGVIGPGTPPPPPGTPTPTVDPSATPTEQPTTTPTVDPTATPTVDPSATPTVDPSATPTGNPSATPTGNPSPGPTGALGTARQRR